MKDKLKKSFQILPSFGDAETLGELFAEVYKYALIIVGFAVFIQFLRAGFAYLTAAGNASKTGEAKTLMTNAVAGVLILVASVLILNIINPDLSSGRNPGVKPFTGEGVEYPEVCEFDVCRDAQPGNEQTLKDLGIDWGYNDVSEMSKEAILEAARLKQQCMCKLSISYEKKAGGEVITFHVTEKNVFGIREGYNRIYDNLDDPSQYEITGDTEYKLPSGVPAREVIFRDKETGAIYTTTQGCALFKCNGDEVFSINVRLPN